MGNSHSERPLLASKKYKFLPLGVRTSCHTSPAQQQQQQHHSKMGGQCHSCHFDEQTNVFFTYFNLSFVTGRRDIQMMAFRWNPVARDLRRFPLRSIRRFVVVKTLVGLMFQQTFPEHTKRKKENKSANMCCRTYPTRFRADLPITVHVFHHCMLAQLFPHFST